MVRLFRLFALGTGFGLVLISCASFSYQYYGLDLPNQKLLGPTEKEDKPLTVCNPNDTANFPCVVLFQDEFFKLAQENAELKERLKDCEENPIYGAIEGLRFNARGSSLPLGGI